MCVSGAICSGGHNLFPEPQGNSKVNCTLSICYSSVHSATCDCMAAGGVPGGPGPRQLGHAAIRDDLPSISCQELFSEARISLGALVSDAHAHSLLLLLPCPLMPRICMVPLASGHQVHVLVERFVHQLNFICGCIWSVLHHRCIAIASTLVSW